MEQNVRCLFKYLALVARGIGVFPFIIVFSYIYSKQYNEALFAIHLIGLIIVIVIGYMQVSFHAYLEQRLERKKWLERMIVGIFYMLEVGVIVNGVWNYLQTNTIMKFITCIIYIVMFIMSVQAYEQHYTRVLTIELIVIISFCYVIAMLLSKHSILGIMYLFTVATYIFLNNQQNLEQLSQSTKENTPMFKSIRKDNMKWVSLVMGFILIVYPCRFFIADILCWIWQRILSVMGLILYIIITVLSLLSSGESTTEGEASEVGIGYLEPVETNEWLDVIFWVLVVIISIYVCIKRRKEIMAAIYSRWIKIKDFCMRVYALLFGKKQNSDEMEEYYEDMIEEISVPIIIKQRKTQKMTQKRWAKQVKKYLKSASEGNQYREGYKLLLQGINMIGIEIQKVYTPREIMKQMEKIMGMPSIEVETRCYEGVRYGEEEATIQEVDELKEILRKLTEIKVEKVDLS